MKVHSTAIVSNKAQIHDSVEIGAYAIVGDDVRIGEGTVVMAHAYLTGFTTIGKNNRIHIGAVIGHEPQDYAFDKTMRSYLELGDNNIIREYVTLHRGTKPESKTVIGNNNMFMATSHLGHNVTAGNNIIMANGAAVGGYAVIGDNAFLSGGSMVHQFVRVGRLAMLGGGARTTKDIPPFTSSLHLNKVGALNLIGMKRAGLSAQAIREVKECYKIFYLSHRLRQDAIDALHERDFQTKEAQEFISFIDAAGRPIATREIRGE